ncbi:peptidase E [Proteobacteria bacterium 005FR1]|nr:peptidase E [Proteobacteria bacterium 005FR1]
MHIVSVGGGDINRETRGKGTFAIDSYIVELAGKERPKALFIPTASGDDPEYCRSFAEVYGQVLGCEVEALLLSGADKDPDRIRRKISQADLIYVGGGYTPRMLEKWRNCGVDEQLKAAHRRGTVLAGISAGAICWHEWGHSNSYASSRTGKSRYQRVQGLGLRQGTFCPHLDEEQRHASFVRVIEQCGGLGIACEDGAAVHYSGNQQARVVSDCESAGVVLYRRGRIEVVRERLENGRCFEVPVI